MTTILFATNNRHKIDEIRAAIGHLVNVTGLQEAGIELELIEPHNTVEANASEKAAAVFAVSGTSCFSEDTGLEVYSLDNEPGVHSARYAGEARSDDDNINKLLHHLQGKDRHARFRTIISLIWEGQEYVFEGICEGKIAENRQGTSGFGYDPVFIPSGSDRSFGEMTTAEKNALSHRRKAADKLVLFLQQQTGVTTKQ